MFEFEFQRSEHVRACRAIHRHALRNRPVRIALYVGLLVYGVVVVGNIAADLSRGSYPASLPALIAFAFPVLPTLNGYFAAREWEKHNPVGRRRITIAIDDMVFRTSSFAGTLELRWDAFKQVVETPDFMLFYVTNQIAHYLPKRAMPVSALPQIREIVRSKVAAERVHLLAEATHAA